MLDAAKIGFLDFPNTLKVFGSPEVLNTVLVGVGIVLSVICNFKFGSSIWDRWDY